MATATLERLPNGGGRRHRAGPGPVHGGNVSRRGRATALTCAVTVVLGVEVVLVAPYLGTAVASLLRAAPGWAGLALLATAGSLTAFALTRRRLLRTAGVRVSTRSSLASILISNAFHVTLPGGVAFSTGYSYRWMREHGAGPTVAGWSLAVNGLLSSACLVGLGLAASLLGGRCELGAAAAAGRRRRGAGARRTARGAATRSAPLAAAGSLLAAANRLLRRPAATGTDRLAETATQLRSVRPTARDWTAATEFALLNWVLDLACLALCARATGLPDLTLGATGGGLRCGYGGVEPVPAARRPRGGGRRPGARPRRRGSPAAALPPYCSTG